MRASRGALGCCPVDSDHYILNLCSFALEFVSPSGQVDQCFCIGALKCHIVILGDFDGLVHLAGGF